jgi:hypothetical protein
MPAEAYCATRTALREGLKDNLLGLSIVADLTTCLLQNLYVWVAFSVGLTKDSELLGYVSRQWQMKGTAPVRRLCTLDASRPASDLSQVPISCSSMRLPLPSDALADRAAWGYRLLVTNSSMLLQASRQIPH